MSEHEHVRVQSETRKTIVNLRVPQLIGNPEERRQLEMPLALLWEPDRGERRPRSAFPCAAAVARAWR